MKKILFIFVIALSLYFRFTGINWDQNQHLHPDERFLTMVTLALKWPESVEQYLDTSVSPANPHNQGQDFFVYGTYPLLLTKAIAEFFHQYSYNEVTFYGRALSALFDVGTGLLVFLISRRVFHRFSSALLSSLCYGLSVLPIQLSHFFASDTFMVFFLLLTFYFLICFYQKPKKIFALLMGLSFGLAFSAKVNAALVLPVVAASFLILLLKKTSFSSLFTSGIIFLVTSILVIRLFYPYLFTDIFSLNPKLISNWIELQRLGRPDFYYPPTIQWIHILPGWFPFDNLIFWGLGLPLAIVSLIALSFYIYHFHRSFLHFSFLIFILVVFVYQSTQTSQPLRYFYPLYPLLAVISGWLLSQIRHKLLLISILLLIIIYPLSFIQIYHRPHTRLSASEWIFTHVPAGSVLSCEYWDDCLPLLYPARPFNPYIVITLSPYDPDSSLKWQELSQKISTLDYIILSSNRLYGSISASPQHYPQTTKYYQQLFSGQLGFTRVAQFTSRPTLPFPLIYCLNPSGFTYGRVAAVDSDCAFNGLSFVDDYTDETFTVYDHPKVTIFQNTSHLTPAQIYALIFSST